MQNQQSGRPARLISHFDGRGRTQQNQGWSELWESEASDLWDRGMPSPALIDFVESKPAITQPRQTGKRLKALVPGCGKGYDVAMLALHGFDVYGLEVSEKGAEIARQYVRSQLAEPCEYNFGEASDWTTQPGNVKIVAGDFFRRDWETECGDEGQVGFDLIFDYTFLCAILPEMRKDWASRMSRLLLPKGILVCLEFPLYKDVKEVGPPWGLRGVYWNILAQGGDGLTLDVPNNGAESSAGVFERVLYFKPPRSYENGKGTDMVSVWTLQ